MNKTYRPWGWYENLQEDDGYKIKTIYVNPNQKISLQYHNQRSEHWVVVFGEGELTLDDEIRNVNIGDYIFVPVMSKHRISAGNNGIMIVEIQMGKVCDEEDIVRIEDDYGRV